MPQVVGFDEALSRIIPREGRSRVPFLDASASLPDQPFAFMNRVDAGRITPTHYHYVDQWQFIAEGNATLGRDQVAPYCIHFNRAFTPYGPLIAAAGGMGYFDLYSRYSPGALYLTGPLAQQNLKALKEIKNRRPWQIKSQVTFPSQRNSAAPTQTLLEVVPEIQDDNGLFACTLTVAPNETARAPDPSKGNGQYIVGVKGSLQYGGQTHNAFVVVFVEANHGPFEVHAGPEGLEALVLNFPRAVHREMAWKCGHCDFVYDETVSVTAFGERWVDLPEDWTCPKCATPMREFEMFEVT